MFDSTQVACYARLSALSQRRATDAPEASLYTLGSLVLALQVQDGSAPLAGSGDVIQLIQDTGPLNQAILAILFIFSVTNSYIHRKICANIKWRIYIDKFQTSLRLYFFAKWSIFKRR